MKVFILSFFILAGASLSSCSEKELYPSGRCHQELIEGNIKHPKSADLQALITAYRKKGLPGFALLINDAQGTWLGVEGKADIQHNIDMLPCHIGEVASITKLFFATLVFKLQEEGVLHLDDPISKHLPSEIIERIENADQMTLRMLLNHTSGLYDHTEDNEFYLAVLNDPARNWTQEELLQYVYGKPADFAPGNTTSYSNSNTLLASLLVEYATSVPHEQLLREKVLNPLGLLNTYYHPHEQPPANKVTQGYFDLYNNGTIINMTNFNTGNGNGYNGIYSTVHDLYKFIDALLLRKTILSQNSLDEMLTFHPDEFNEVMLGVGIIKDFIHREDPSEYAIGHTGRDLAYTGEIFWFPEKNVTYTLLINYGNDVESDLQPIYYEFRDELVDILMQ